MDYLGVVDLSFLKEKNDKYVHINDKDDKNKEENNSQNDKKFKIKTTKNFQLILTEGTPCDKNIDDIIKKWTDSVPKMDGADEVLCIVGKSFPSFFPLHYFHEFCMATIFQAFLTSVNSQQI